MTAQKKIQFVLNTSFDPHFCALFNQDDKLIAQHRWMTPREDGQHIWNFLNEHLAANTVLSFIGGVNGPGSFSSLRTAGAVLNALSFKFALSVHQARADQVVEDFLIAQERADTAYLLNSFGSRVFWPQNGKLEVIDLSTQKLPTNKKFITSWLPEAKKNKIQSQAPIDPFGPLQTLLKTLKKTPPKAHFTPNYEYPPVQKNS